MSAFIQSNISEYIGNETQIYSLKYGVGKMTGLFLLYDGIEDHIEITFKSKLVKNFPVSDLSQFRAISNFANLTLILRELMKKLPLRTFKRM